MVVHDGTQPEIPDAEKLLVGQRFASFVDYDMLAGKFASSVRPGDDIMVPASLRLRRPVAPAKYWGIAVESSRPYNSEIFTPSELIVKSVVLHNVYDNIDHETVAYRLGADAIVRRWDAGDVAVRLERDKRMRLDLSRNDEVAEVEGRLQELLGFLVEGMSNARLQADMGINLQPIGMSELEGLIAFVTHPDVVPAPGI